MCVCVGGGGGESLLGRSFASSLVPIHSFFAFRSHGEEKLPVHSSAKKEGLGMRLIPCSKVEKYNYIPSARFDYFKQSHWTRTS